MSTVGALHGWLRDDKMSCNFSFWNEVINYFIPLTQTLFSKCSFSIHDQLWSHMIISNLQATRTTKFIFGSPVIKHERKHQYGAIINMLPLFQNSRPQDNPRGPWKVERGYGTLRHFEFSRVNISKIYSLKNSCTVTVLPVEPIKLQAYPNLLLIRRSFLCNMQFWDPRITSLNYWIMSWGM
jgi:hypothetical protein